MFKNTEFESKYSVLISSINKFLVDREFDSDEIKADNIVTWILTDKGRIITPTETCPKEFRNSIIQMIKEVFPII